MQESKANAQTRATEKYQKKAGYISKAYKLKNEVAVRFAKACEAKGISQAAQLTELMESFSKQYL